MNPTLFAPFVGEIFQDAATKMTAAAREFLQAELAAGQAARETLPVLRPGNVASELNVVFQALISEAFAQ